MSNTLSIKEVTLAQISDASHAINVIGSAAGNARLSVYQPATVRVTNHSDDDGGTTDNAEGMALFTSKAHGQPWCADKGHKEHLIHPKAGATPAPIASGTTMNIIFPDFDYSTFE
jgi:hypothetical protein